MRKRKLKKRIRELEATCAHLQAVPQSWRTVELRNRIEELKRRNHNLENTIEAKNRFIEGLQHEMTALCAKLTAAQEERDDALEDVEKYIRRNAELRGVDTRPSHTGSW
jgi:chromosome segregation ATPase